MKRFLVLAVLLTAAAWGLVAWVLLRNVGGDMLLVAVLAVDLLLGAFAAVPLVLMLKRGQS